MSALKLQINSVEAISKLIGNDTEIEIELRQSVVNEFAKKYLKVEIEKYFAQIKNNLAAEVRKVADESLGMKSSHSIYSGYTYTIAPEIKNLIQSAVKEAIATEIREACQKQIECMDLEALIKSKVTFMFNDRFNQEVKQEVARKLAEVVAKLAP